MTLLEALRVAWEALGTNKMRSVLTMLGIIIGVGSVIAIFAIGRGTGMAVEGELSSLGSGQIILQPGSSRPGTVSQRTEPFTEADMKNMEALLPDVEAAVTFFQFSGPVRYERETVFANGQGHYAKSGPVFDIRLSQGRWFSEAEDASVARVAILGNGLAKKLMGETVNPIGKSVNIAGFPFLVIGETAPATGMLASLGGSDDNNFYVPLNFARRLLGNPPIAQVVLKARKGANSTTVMNDAIALAERNHKGAAFSGQSFDQILSVITKVLSIVTGVLSAVAGISLVVGGVGIMNIMLVSVTERTREIGIRKAIGASYQNILVQFLIEAILLSLIGGSIGVGLAAVPVWLVGRWLHVPLLLDWLSVTLALGFSAGVGVLFGVYPAAKAARLDPIDALRFE